MSADAGEIAGVDVRAWWHAYREFLDEQRLLERTVEQRTSDWQELLTGDAPETWAFEVGGRIAGYISVGASRDPDAVAGDDRSSTVRTGALVALYVDPPAQGAGVGTALLAHARSRLSALGHPVATLWTFEANGLARAFYERDGWELDPGGNGNESCEWWAPAVRYRTYIG